MQGITLLYKMKNYVWGKNLPNFFLCKIKKKFNAAEKNFRIFFWGIFQKKIEEEKFSPENYTKINMSQLCYEK